MTPVHATTFRDFSSLPVTTLVDQDASIQMAGSLSIRYTEAIVQIKNAEKRRTTMKPRMNYFQAAPETIKALVALEEQIQASGLDKPLIELVKTRASQINGCAFCINMHTQDARKQGETEQRLYLLNAWRESPLYTDRERAALAWTEALTLIAETHAPDNLYEDVRAHFSEAETVNLTMLIGAINAWNRLAIAFRAVHPVKAKAAA
jgi:AhpD family alkylhydroperoxidase